MLPFSLLVCQVRRNGIQTPLRSGPSKKKDKFIQEHLYIEQEPMLNPQIQKEKENDKDDVDRGIVVIEMF